MHKTHAVVGKFLKHLSRFGPESISPALIHDDAIHVGLSPADGESYTSAEHFLMLDALTITLQPSTL